MKRIIFLTVLFANLSLLTTGCSSNRGRTDCHIIFSIPDSTSIPYRIPAIASCDDGTLVAMADYRHCRADIGFGRVDLHSRISTDGGACWEETTTVIEGSGIHGSADCGFGDPAIVSDSETGELLLIAVCGETIYWSPSTNRLNPNRIAMIRSKDRGRTWSDWCEITEPVYSIFDSCSKGCVQSCFVSSGKIFQSRTVKEGSHYRLYAALCARPNGNRVIYSDDFGSTWHALGGPDSFPAPDGDEAKCEELPDGRVVLSSRTEGGRIFNIFSYTDTASGSGSWAQESFSGAENNGCTALDNACNGEILILPVVRKSDGRHLHLALQSVPAGPRRTKVGIYFKEIPDDSSAVTPDTFASDWSGPYPVSDTDSAYSTMTVQADGRIAFFYEETINADGTGYNLVYKAIPVSVLTCGLYM